MAVTVADLLGTPRLRLTLVAGERGVRRPVAWAHGSDVEDPWEWLAGDELLMKNGRTLPKTGAAQARFVRHVADTGASGLVIGDDPRTPALTGALVDAADRLGFPVLRVPYSVGFVTIAREVADANAGADARRLARVERLYGTVRSLIGRPGRRSLLADLGAELGCELYLIDPYGGDPVLHADRELRADLREAAVAAVAGRGGAMPGILRVTGEHEPSAVATELPYPEPTMLVAVGLTGTSPEIALLQHAATAVAVELTTVMLRLEHQRRTGAELLANLLDQRIDAEQAHARLGETGLDAGTAVLALVRDANADAERGLHLGLAHRHAGHLLLRRGELLYVLLPGDGPGLTVLAGRLGDRAAIGVSAPLADPARAPAAYREALWALATADRPGRVARYGEAAPMPALRDPDEAQALVDRVLGALIAYDHEHRTDLVATLRTFLSHRRSWQRTAEALNVHKHTVVYRMQRVEHLTGKTLAETPDLAELWLAIRAHQILSG